MCILNTSHRESIMCTTSTRFLNNVALCSLFICSLCASALYIWLAAVLLIFCLPIYTYPRFVSALANNIGSINIIRRHGKRCKSAGWCKAHPVHDARSPRVPTLLCWQKTKTLLSITRTVLFIYSRFFLFHLFFEREAELYNFKLYNGTASSSRWVGSCLVCVL